MSSCLRYFLIERLLTSKRSRRTRDSGIFMLASGAKAGAEVEEDPQDGHGRHGEDDAEETRDLAPGYDGQKDQDRRDLEGVSLNPRGQDVALQLLNCEEHQCR